MSYYSNKLENAKNLISDDQKTVGFYLFSERDAIYRTVDKCVESFAHYNNPGRYSHVALIEHYRDTKCEYKKIHTKTEVTKTYFIINDDKRVLDLDDIFSCYQKSSFNFSPKSIAEGSESFESELQKCLEFADYSTDIATIITYE